MQMKPKQRRRDACWTGVPWMLSRGTPRSSRGGGAAEELATILGSRWQQLSPVSSRTRRGFLAISLISTRCQQKRAWEGCGRFGPWRGSLPAAAPPTPARGQPACRERGCGVRFWVAQLHGLPRHRMRRLFWLGCRFGDGVLFCICSKSCMG